MHNYGVQPEIVRLALVIGIVISTLIYERWHVTSGAVVVTGYLALFVNRPVYIVVTVALGLITYQIVQRFIAPRIFLYGRRRLVVMVLTGMVLQIITGLIAFAVNSSLVVNNAVPLVAGLYGVGFLLPGLIAQDMERQGSNITLLALAGATLLTYLILQNIEFIKTYLPPAWSIIAFDTTVQYSYHSQLLIPAVILSVVVSAALFEWRGIRSGGFVTAAYTALFVLQPLHLIFIIGASYLVNFVVTHWLIPFIPIFGRTKFAMMVLSGVVFMWLLEVVVMSLTHNAFTPFAGFSIISPMIVSLIANDGERQGMGKTLIGVTICTAVIFVIIKGADLLFIG